MYISLREETLKVLVDNGKTWDDIIGVCGDDYQITKEQFWELSNVKYDNGYGGNEVAMDLKIVGIDFWLERHEYDGAEWWEFKQIPNLFKLPMAHVNRVIRDDDHYWAGSIEELNEVLCSDH